MPCSNERCFLRGLVKAKMSRTETEVTCVQKVSFLVVFINSRCVQQWILRKFLLCSHEEDTSRTICASVRSFPFFSYHSFCTPAVWLLTLIRRSSFKFLNLSWTVQRERNLLCMKIRNIAKDCSRRSLAYCKAFATSGALSSRALHISLLLYYTHFLPPDYPQPELPMVLQMTSSCLALDQDQLQELTVPFLNFITNLHCSMEGHMTVVRSESFWKTEN